MNGKECGSEPRIPNSPFGLRGKNAKCSERELGVRGLFVSELVIFVLFLLILIILNSPHAPNYISAATSPDAIAIRVIPNPDHYSPLHWYQNQGFTGSPQSLTVDGYEAVRDGRTVYVNAANVDATNLYTNIYLISYNQDAESATVDIFGRILEHWKFNTNVSGVGVCSKIDIQIDCTGTVGCWPLNGDFKDYSGNNNNGAEQGGVVFNSGVVNRAAYFDGSDDYVDLGPNFKFSREDSFSVKTWVKPETGGGIIGVQRGPIGDGGWTLVIKNDGKIEVLFIGGVEFIPGLTNYFVRASTNNKISFNEWHYIAFTFKGSNQDINGQDAIKIYVDRNLQAHNSSQIWDKRSDTLDFTMLNALIGKSRENQYFKGFIDELRVYNKTLTASEIIQDNYNQIYSQCLADSECSSGGYCSSLKSRIIRDTLRLSELVEVKLKLAEFKQSNNHYPKLDSGTYLTNKTISTWPSWQETLAKELGAALPLDPINKLGACFGYDSTTCWDEQTKKFADPTPSDGVFNLPNNSNSYVYTTNAQGATYSICANMESGLISPTMGNCIGNVIANNSPVINGVNLPIVGSGKEYIGYVSATDPDGDILSWSIDTSASLWTGWSAPPVLQPAGTNSQRKIYAAKTGNIGTYSFYITVSDGRGGSYTNTAAYQIIIGNCVDSDSDGYGSCPNCGVANGCLKNGNDCDDTKNYINPGSAETCDNNDNNCDSQTDEGCDDDTDDYCDKSMKFYNYPVAACPNSNLANGSWGDDCDDSKNNIKPGATETCNNGIDEDCNGSDLSCTTICTDIDHDGYGSPASTACAYATMDCNDNDANIKPGMPDICDGIDNDCNGIVDDSCDKDNDNYCDCTQSFTFGSDLTAICSGTNTTDNSWWNSTCDCNDNNIGISPGAVENCTNTPIDDDCDTDVDCADAQCFAAPTCVAACGDGTCNVAGGECSSCPSDNCTLAVCCGNLVPDLAVGEQCDDGKNGINDECTDNCAKTYCGDTIIQNSPQNGDGIAEQCDDGNTTSGDGCDENCQNSCVNSPASMIGWWPGDNNANDIENSNNGTLGGDAKLSPGKVNNSFDLDGNSDYAGINDSGVVNLDGFSELTIDAWVYPRSFPGGNENVIVSKYDSTLGNGISYLFSIPNGQLRLSVANLPSIETLYSINLIALNSWSHVVGIWKGGNYMELYINGVKDSSNNIGGSFANIANNNVQVNIGQIFSYSGSFVGPGGYFNGFIDEVEIFNRALNQTEIQSIHGADYFGKCK